MDDPKRGEGMSGDSDLIKLYSQRILALAADIPHTERLPGPQATVRRRSPLCGSTVTVDVTADEGRIAAFGQEVRACALGQASAAIAGAAMTGRSADEVRLARDQLHAVRGV
jgi:NifU-like protein involved in Fe-S cluster formation